MPTDRHTSTTSGPARHCTRLRIEHQRVVGAAARRRGQVAVGRQRVLAAVLAVVDVERLVAHHRPHVLTRVPARQARGRQGGGGGSERPAAAAATAGRAAAAERRGYTCIRTGCPVPPRPQGAPAAHVKVVRRGGIAAGYWARFPGLGQSCWVLAMHSAQLPQRAGAEPLPTKALRLFGAPAEQQQLPMITQKGMAGRGGGKSLECRAPPPAVRLHCRSRYAPQPAARLLVEGLVTMSMLE